MALPVPLGERRFQNMRTKPSRNRGARTAPNWITPLHQELKRQLPGSTREVARALGLSERVTLALLEDLCEAGMVKR